MSVHVVRVSPLPDWLDWRRLLGPGAWRAAPNSDAGSAYQAELERADAADLAARLRGVGIGGASLNVEVQPPLPRSAVRRARADEARRYRAGSAGFERAGARIDAEGKRSLTPEALALQLGLEARGAHVLDACCGAGGNAIGFARAGCRVTAIELDPARLELARHNARVYGVADSIRFLVGDARTLIPNLDADLLFVDPPWGERYDKDRVVLADLPLLAALLPARARFARTWLKVPPSFDPACVAGARPHAWFGAGEGDARRVKFLLLVCEPAAGDAAG
jgi:SAM-dependent methyltransferase